MPDSTTTRPGHLHQLWRTCAEPGDVDANNPLTSIVEAYLLVAEARVQRLGGIPWGDGEHADEEEDDHAAEVIQHFATCAACGAGNLEHFYTSKRRGKMLCPTCYDRRAS